jgi:YHS domain-containing protein
MPHPATPVLTRRDLFGLAAAGLFASARALAAPPVNTLTSGVLSRRSDIAIQGYDSVAYFTVGRPIKGQDRFATDWKGAKWKFASQSNLDLFKSDPEKYAPQYGGYCAYGVAQDNLVSIEPDKFTVRDGKLYLNYNAEVQALWLKDPAGFIRQADAKFATLLKQ